MPDFFPHTSLRRSPYYEATIAEGATVMHPYNRMLMPLGYGSPEASKRCVESPPSAPHGTSWGLCSTAMTHGRVTQVGATSPSMVRRWAT